MQNNRINVPVAQRTRTEVQIGPVKARFGDTISFEAQDSDITVFVPDAKELFGTDRLFDIAQNEQKEFSVALKLNPGEERRYRYALYHKNTKDFAVGNSSPEIIVQG